MRRPHDPFLKRFYRAGARDAIWLFFPELAAHIDWSKLRWIEKEVPILGETPRSIVADLVGLTQDVEGRYVEVLIHPEIQMEARPNMGWRVTQYNSGLLLQQANPEARVLTFVFYHCRGVGGIQQQRHQLEFYGEVIHEVAYWTVGLGDLDADAYAASENPVAWALAAWMRQRRTGRVELRLRLIEKILRFVGDPEYRWLLLDAVRTYFRLNRTEQEEEQRVLQSQAYQEVNQMLQTELERLEDAAERRGEARGQREALQSAVMEVVEERFPGVPESVAARIRGIQDLAALKDLIRRAAGAASLEEIERLLNP